MYELITCFHGFCTLISLIAEEIGKKCGGGAKVAKSNLEAENPLRLVFHCILFVYLPKRYNFWIEIKLIGKKC
jgi:hypothetical protein